MNKPNIVYMLFDLITNKDQTDICIRKAMMTVLIYTYIEVVFALGNVDFTID